MRKKKNIQTRKRALKRPKNITHNCFKIFGINAAGIKSKIKSFDDVISRLKPQIWMVEETKLKSHEKLQGGSLDDFQIYYLSRQNSQGGGIAMGINKMFQSTILNCGDDDTEVMSVLVMVGSIPIRVLVAYGVQENASKEKKRKFWEFIEDEICQASNENQGLLIQMDGNLHAGEKLVMGDPNPQNQNGRIFMEFLQRNPDLVVVNSESICEGIITRQRQVQTKTEKAVLDFFIVNDKLAPFLKKMIVDEEKEYALNNFAQTKKNRRVIESDHNGLILELSLQYQFKKPERRELFNFKSKEAQEAFKNETEINEELLNCFENDLSLEVQSKRWLKTFNSILQKCFRKIRICKKKNINDNTEKSLIKERIDLKKEIKSTIMTEELRHKIEERIQDIEKEIGNKVVESYHKEILDTIKDLGGDESSLDGSGRNKMWAMLKRKFPKTECVIPVGKKDRKGNIITNHMGLKHLYLKTYVGRLRDRPIREDFLELKKLKQILFNLRLELSKSHETRPWEMSDLEAAIKELKKDKARDPNGWSNELFMKEVSGTNLKISMLKLFNKIKMENHYPDFMRKADVTTIYKGKGSKTDLNNDRGVFVVSVFRSLIMKLIYKDIYETINKSMSDSQIGSRKNMNIRNHIWVVNSIICDVNSTKNKNPIDIQIYDYRQCFDSLWLEECLNDMYAGGLNNDKLNLLYQANSHVKVAVRTPVGKTNSEDIYNVVIQGDVFSSLLCSKQVETFAKECLESNKYLYKYKDDVPIPPLSMVDDILCVSECGYQTALLNSYLKCKTSTKKLQFGIDKCKKIHIGKTHEEYKCQPIYVDKWTEHEEENKKTGIIEIKDVFEGEEVMGDSNSEKYLGDIISKDGRNILNIKARLSKGKGIIKKILNILNCIPFGKLFYQIAILLRNSLLVSSVLCNSEAWFNLTNSDLKMIETIDIEFLRKILKAPVSTPKEILFLELGVLPLREIIKQRRLNFLFYLIHQKNESMLKRVFQSQMKNRTKRDWISTVLKDMEELDLNLTFADIQKMSKGNWKDLIKRNILDRALFNLLKIKEKHSKVTELKYEKMEMQSYFLPNRMECSREDIELIFRIRSNMTNVKMNRKQMYKTHECSKCLKENETQQHVYTCNKIWEEMGKRKENYPKYEKIINGFRNEKIRIAKIFKDILKIVEKYSDQNNKIK